MVRPVMILAGGTGGHVFPALAVAEVLRTRQIPVVWVGTPQGIEARLVPAAGFTLEPIRLQGLRRRSWGGLLMAVPQVLRGMRQGWRLIRQYRPRVVLGMGGYASSSVALTAWLCRIPLVIHEQNAAAGFTNRILAHIARTVLLGFKETSGIHGGTWVGNPVRASLKPVAAAPGRRLRMLVIGGSQGAQVFNEVIPQALHQLAEVSRPEVWHQTGQDPQAVAECYPPHSQVRVNAFIDEMDEAYAWADLVVARAGAMTLAELAATERPAVLVPYPHAADDHQAHNAHRYAAAGAARVIPQSEFRADRLAELLIELSRTPASLQAMRKAARAQACAQAAERVADCLLEVQG